jgi:hypothetical protein
MKTALCVLCFCLGFIATPALADTKGIACPARSEFRCTITCNGVKAIVKCEGGGPNCHCQTKGAQGGHVWIRCKHSGQKEATCGANERPYGHCSGGKTRAGCTNWVR